MSREFDIQLTYDSALTVGPSKQNNKDGSKYDFTIKRNLYAKGQHYDNNESFKSIETNIMYSFQLKEFRDKLNKLLEIHEKVDFEKEPKRVNESAWDRDRAVDMEKLADSFFDNLIRDNCEYGGWGLGDKRPFGNSDVDIDILDIIEFGYLPNEDEYTEAQKEYAHELYGDLGEYLKTRWYQLKGVSVTND